MLCDVARLAQQFHGWVENCALQFLQRRMKLVLKLSQCILVLRERPRVRADNFTLAASLADSSQVAVKV